MPILATLRQDRAGEWKSLEEYLRELRHRETGALAALGSALSAPAQEHKELAEHREAGAVLLEVACDLRVPKGARLAAARCLLEAGIEAPFVGHLFVGAGDLVTDPRLGGLARKLVESGLPVALELGGEAAQITLAAGAFARAAHAGASVVGVDRLKELLASAPELHAGAIAGLFALGEAELPEGHRTGWKRLLEQTCSAHRRAPAAARRVGLAPPWPPNLPEAFAPMIREAEEQSASVQSSDAAANPAALKKEPPAAPARASTPRDANRGSAAQPGETNRAGKTLAPPIRKSPYRRPTGTVMEVPPAAPAKPMQALGRAPGDAPHKGSDLRFDPLGNRISRADRWSNDQFEWEAPVLPSSDLPPPPRAQVAPGPFASRLLAVFEDRPEAVDRLCAAAEARAAVRGEEELLRELRAEVSRIAWRSRTLPELQRERLRMIAQDSLQPAAWRAAAGLLLDFFVSGGK